jgi:LAS superfamily LD-carboxypeptidase LdcB
MAIEEQVLREISESVQKVGDSSESFRFTAAQQNNNIQKIVKDISSMFRSQTQAQSELSGSIDEVRQAMQNNSDKTDAVASNLEQTINVQNSMLGELRGIGKGIDNLSSNMNNMMIMMQQQMSSGGGGGFGGGAGGAGGGTSRLGRILLGAAGLGVGAAGITAAVLNTRNDNTRDGLLGMGGRNSGADTEIDSLLAAIKKRESGGEAGFGRDAYKAIARDNNGNPIEGATASGAYQFTDATWKSAAKMAGVSTEEYPRALSAPPEVQDRVAKQYISYLREKAGGDASLVPVAYKGGERYLEPEYRRQNMSADLQQYQQDVMSNVQSNSAAPSSSAGSSEDYAKFLASKAQSNVDVEKLNPGFAKNLVAAMQAAKEATGEDVLITSAYRSPEQQAQLYANYIKGPFEYKGKVYQPNAEQNYPVAKPGNSAHETGKAVDLSSGKAREWIRANAAKFGLKDLAGDEVHFSDAGASPEGEPNQQEITPQQARDAAMAAASTPESQSGSLMAGLGMPAGMGPGSEPIPIGMDDMSSYNPMGIMGALMGGNMLGPSGQMGAIGAALNVAGGMLSPGPDTRASVLNQAAAEESAAGQWRDPGTVPGYEPPAEGMNRGQRIDPDTYNHPEDRTISPSWSDRIMGMFPQETGGILPTRR